MNFTVELFPEGGPWTSLRVRWFSCRNFFDCSALQMMGKRFGGRTRFWTRNLLKSPEWMVTVVSLRLRAGAMYCSEADLRTLSVEPYVAMAMTSWRRLALIAK